ncbi:MAG: thiamine phosphate synthase [Candidatus Accumulibacter sp.]|jgi:thiamine-phosphate pyrophosphorylase|nr:thiamine phosphate synthase [Accumulibacter sp.]
MNHRGELRGLYAITPETEDAADGLARVRAALSGGARIVQYRDKTGDAARRLTMALALRAATRDHRALLIVNDSPLLALAANADGVHLGDGDGDPAAARGALGPGRILGISCYGDFERARAAARAGADYVAFGAVFASPTKPRAARADLALFRRCRDELGIPACAIGGITRDNARAVAAAGADMLAVISDLFQAGDLAAVETRARAFQALFEEHLHEQP